MIWLEKLKILTHLQKLPKNVWDLSRVMEYVEHASFVEIYGLKLA